MEENILNIQEEQQPTEDATQQDPAAEQEPVQEPKTPTERELFEQSIREKYPDLDEEGIYKHARESYGRKKKDLYDLQESSGKVLDLLETSPDAIAFFEAISEVGDVEDALQILPEDVLQRAFERKQQGYKLSDEEKEAKISKHRDKIQSNKALKKTLEENSTKSLTEIENYAKKVGKKPEEVINDLLPFLQKIHDNQIDESILNALYLDNLKKSEYEKGLTDGRNGKIEQETLKKEKGSGLPRPKGNSGDLTKKTEKSNGNPFDFMIDG